MGSLLRLRRRRRGGAVAAIEGIEGQHGLLSVSPCALAKELAPVRRARAANTRLRGFPSDYRQREQIPLC